MNPETQWGPLDWTMTELDRWRHGKELLLPPQLCPRGQYSGLAGKAENKLFSIYMSEKFMVSFGPKDTPFGVPNIFPKLLDMNSNVPHPQIPSTTPQFLPGPPKCKAPSVPTLAPPDRLTIETQGTAVQMQMAVIFQSGTSTGGCHMMAQQEFCFRAVL